MATSFETRTLVHKTWKKWKIGELVRNKTQQLPQNGERKVGDRNHVWYILVFQPSGDKLSLTRTYLTQALK